MSEIIINLFRDTTFWGSLIGTGLSGSIAIYIMRSRIRYDEAIRSRESIENFLKVNSELSRELQNAIASLDFYNDAFNKKKTPDANLKMLQESLEKVVERLEAIELKGVEYRVEVIYSAILNDLNFVLRMDYSAFFEVFEVDKDFYEKHKALYYNQIEKRLEDLKQQLDVYNEEQVKKYKKIKKITDL